MKGIQTSKKSATFLLAHSAVKIIAVVLTCLGLPAANADATPGDFIVQLTPSQAGQPILRMNLLGELPANSKVRDLGFNGWVHVQVPPQMRSFNVFNALSKVSGVTYVQPNYKIRLHEQPGMAAVRAKLATMRLDDTEVHVPKEDNPEIPGVPNSTTGADPLFNNQWGMFDIGVRNAWGKSRGNKNVVVAVIDSGVDYQHEDLVENLWRNPGESGTDSQGRDKSKNGVDDDGNNYVDDIIGWDFSSKDNKPYDLAVEPIDLIIGGGNPGHGTHCAGNIAARGENGKGVSGVAPNVSIMPLRFISQTGEGTTADAVEAIAYAVRNGAMVTSNSWGSEGDDPDDAAGNKALHDVIQLAQDRGVLFIAAAGNGHNGVGYDNDTDPKPAVPASYSHDIIVSVAALDVNDALGSFSNWGPSSVDLGAPGVKVFSTTVGSQYADTILDMFGIKITWDGTSMATPHVAGAAALYWSQNPNATWSQVKAALLASATPISSLNGKTVSGGKLNVDALLNR